MPGGDQGLAQQVPHEEPQIPQVIDHLAGEFTEIEEHRTHRVALVLQEAKSGHHAFKARLAICIVLRTGKVDHIIDTAVAPDYVALYLHLTSVELSVCDGLQGWYAV